MKRCVSIPILPGKIIALVFSTALVCSICCSESAPASEAKGLPEMQQMQKDLEGKYRVRPPRKLTFTEKGSTTEGDAC